MARKLILTIDGGGIRGIIPLCALIGLEKQLQRPAREVFSFMAGTSTGAIIIGGFAAGISAEQVLQMYQNISPQVFKRDRLGFIFSLGSFQYRTKPIADLLRQYYGDVILNELPLDVMITATRVRDGQAFYFVRDNPNNSQMTGKLTLVDCVTASSAAPTFFELWDVPGFGPCVDGGVGIAGNPVYQTCVEAFDYTPPGAYPPDNTTVISLGTGFYPAQSTPANLIQWVQWLIGELLHDPAEQQTQFVQRHYEPLGTKLIRLNPALPKEIGLDDLKAIPELVKIGRELAATLNWKELLSEPKDLKRAPRKLPRNVS